MSIIEDMGFVKDKDSVRFLSKEEKWHCSECGEVAP
jgi:hypothetical protein